MATESPVLGSDSLPASVSMEDSPNQPFQKEQQKQQQEETRRVSSSPNQEQPFAPFEEKETEPTMEAASKAGADEQNGVVKEKSQDQTPHKVKLESEIENASSPVVKELQEFESKVAKYQQQEDGVDSAANSHETNETDTVSGMAESNNGATTEDDKKVEATGKEETKTSTTIQAGEVIHEMNSKELPSPPEYQGVALNEKPVQLAYQPPPPGHFSFSYPPPPGVEFYHSRQLSRSNSSKEGSQGSISPLPPFGGNMSYAPPPPPFYGGPPHHHHEQGGRYSYNYPPPSHGGHGSYSPPTYSPHNAGGFRSGHPLPFSTKFGEPPSSRKGKRADTVPPTKAKQGRKDSQKELLPFAPPPHHGYPPFPPQQPGYYHGYNNGGYGGPPPPYYYHQPHRLGTEPALEKNGAKESGQRGRRSGPPLPIPPPPLTLGMVESNPDAPTASDKKTGDNIEVKKEPKIPPVSADEADKENAAQPPSNDADTSDAADAGAVEEKKPDDEKEVKADDAPAPPEKTDSEVEGAPLTPKLLDLQDEFELDSFATTSPFYPPNAAPPMASYPPQQPYPPTFAPPPFYDYGHPGDGYPYPLAPYPSSPHLGGAPPPSLLPPAGAHGRKMKFGPPPPHYYHQNNNGIRPGDPMSSRPVYHHYRPAGPSPGDDWNQAPSKQPHEALEVRARKNEQSRKRSAVLRERMARIEALPEWQRSQEDQEFYKKSLERKERKNSMSRQRALDKKAMEAEIVRKPEHERTDAERQWLETHLGRRKRKMEGDRLRRVRMKNLGVATKGRGAPGMPRSRPNISARGPLAPEYQAMLERKNGTANIAMDMSSSGSIAS